MCKKISCDIERLVILSCKKKSLFYRSATRFASLSALLFPPYQKLVDIFSKKKKKQLGINNFLNVLVCRIAGYLYSLFVF